MEVWRLLDTGVRTGAENMALDQALLTARARSERVRLTSDRVQPAPANKETSNETPKIPPSMGRDDDARGNELCE